MTPYQAPLRDMLFTMKEVGGLEAICAQPGHEETTPDLVEASKDTAATAAFVGINIRDSNPDTAPAFVRAFRSLRFAPGSSVTSATHAATRSPKVARTRSSGTGVSSTTSCR